MVGMLLAAIVGMTVMLGVGTSDWPLSFRMGGYGALAVVVSAAAYAVPWSIFRYLRRVIDTRTNRRVP